MIRNYLGQQYRMVGEEQGARKDGAPTVLQVWESECAECGATFSFRRGKYIKKFKVNRRCDDHKQPGIRVEKRNV